jgi:hypothetical protein
LSAGVIGGEQQVSIRPEHLQPPFAEAEVAGS